MTPVQNGDNRKFKKLYVGTYQPAAARLAGFLVPMPDKIPLYIVRHGCTKLNGEGGTSEDRIRAWSDVPLTDKGRMEARRAASKLAGKGIGAIVASDLIRAEETAKIIGNILGIKPVFTMKLRPWDLGIFTKQRTVDALPRIEVYVRDTPDKPIPEGESFNTFRDRNFQGFYEAVRDNPGKIVACIAHHRNEMTMLGWDADGQPLSHAIDPDKLLQKGDPPGGIHKIMTTLDALRGKVTQRAA